MFVGLVFLLALCGLIQHTTYCNTSLLLFWPYLVPMLFIKWTFNILHQKADRHRFCLKKKSSMDNIKNEKCHSCSWSWNITLAIFQRLLEGAYLQDRFQMWSQNSNTLSQEFITPLMSISFCKVNCTALQLLSLFCCPSGSHHSLLILTFDSMLHVHKFWNDKTIPFFTICQI